MAKELPYFRFTCQEWITGDIDLESDSVKGLFMDICAYYWLQNCTVLVTKLIKKFPRKTKKIHSLIQSGIIDSADNYIKIKFLDVQLVELKGKRDKKVEAGRIGGKQKASNAKANRVVNSSYKDKDKDKDNTKAPVKKPGRARDPIWDCICEYWNFDPQTKTEKGRIGKLSRDFKLKSATPESIKQAMENYRAAWPDTECSPEALLKHLDRFMPKPLIPRKESETDKLMNTRKIPRKPRK